MVRSTAQFDLPRGFRIWRLLAIIVLISAALGVTSDHSEAQAPVDVVTTDTTITLSWAADGDVKFYWWQPIARKLERVVVSDAKSWTATGLQPESVHELTFFGAFYGSLKFKTKADSEPTSPPPPPTPELSIAAGVDITEGAQATFTLTASPAPTQSLSVSVTPSQSGAFGVGSTAKTVTIGTSGTATVTFATTNDSVDEADGSVTATVDNGTGYTVSSSKGSATLAVADDDVPVLSIASDGNVTEGSAASFTISASPTPHTALTANVDVTAAGSFGVTTGARTVTIPTSGSQSFTVSTSGDTTDEPHGSVTATLSSGTGYTVSSSAGSASATVSDNDDPPPAERVVSITAGSDITEGDDASFTVTVSPQPSSSMPVSLTVSQSGAVLPINSARHILISNYLSRPVTIKVRTVDDSTDEADGTVTVTVDDIQGYAVSTTAGSATLAVSDNDVPELSIASDGNVTEGSAASFTITASPTPHTALTANVDITVAGSFGVTTGARTVTIPTSGSKSFTVSTSGDTTDEPDGSVTATLSSGTDYTVSSSAGSASATVSDDDDSPQPAEQLATQEVIANCVADSLLSKVRHYYDINKNRSPGYGKNWKRVLLAFGDVSDSQLTAFTAAEAQERESRWSGWTPVREALDCIEDAIDQQTPPPPPPTDPEISISSSSNINEGGTVTFTVTATPAPTADLSVSVSVAQSGSYTSQAGARSVTITSTGTASFTIATLDDSNDEPDGSVTATVNTGTGYTVSSSAGSTTANVADNDDPPLPEISISGGPDVAEGGNVSFTVAATPAPSANLDVSVNVTQSGSFTTQTGVQTVTISATGSTSFTVSTDNDATDEPDGSVTATIDTGTGYTVSSSAGSTTVNVTDNDDPPKKQNDLPVISIRKGDAVTEGTHASFWVDSSPSPTTDFDVSITVTQTGMFTSESGQRRVTMSSSYRVPGGTTSHLLVATDDDATDEANGSLTATINPGSKYTVASDGSSATVDALDNDDPPAPLALNQPTVTIADASADEGDSITFTVSVQPTHNAPITLDYETVDYTAISHRHVDDYTAASGQITIPANESSATITVQTTEDTDLEVDDQFTLVLSKRPDTPDDVVLGKSTAIGRIINDEVGTGGTLSYRCIRDEVTDKCKAHTMVLAAHGTYGYNVGKNMNITDRLYQPFRLLHEGRDYDLAVYLSVPIHRTVTFQPYVVQENMRSFVNFEPKYIVMTPENAHIAQKLTIRALPDYNYDTENVTVRLRQIEFANPYFISLNRDYATIDYTRRGVDRHSPNNAVLVEGDDSSTASYRMRLKAPPLPNKEIVVTVTNPDPGAVSVSPDSLIFDFDNWQEWQEFTISPVADMDDSDESVRLTVNIPPPGVWRGEPERFWVHVWENKVARVAASESKVLVHEAGSAHYNVSVRKDPGANNSVTITPTPSIVGVVTVSPATLTFTGGDNGNWRRFQGVTVSGVQDDDAVHEELTISHVVSGDSGDYPSTVNAAEVAVQLMDDEAKVEIMFDRPARFSFNEDDTRELEIGVKLTNDPGPAGGDNKRVVVQMLPQYWRVNNYFVADPPTLTFTTGPMGNWNMAQKIKLKVPQGKTNDGNRHHDWHALRVILGSDVFPLSNLPGYPDPRNSFADAWIHIHFFDKEVPNDVNLSHSALEVKRNGSVEYEIYLGADPGGDVTVTIVNPDPDKLMISENEVTFTYNGPGHWYAKKITLTSKSDSDSVDETLSIVHNYEVEGYKGSSKTLMLTINDDR